MIKPACMREVTATIVLAGTLVVGCGGSNGGGGQNSGNALPACLIPQRPVALAVGVRSNSPMPYLTTAIANIVNSAINAHQVVTLVRLDGNPKAIYSQAFVPTGSNSQTRKVEYNNYVNNLNQILQGAPQAATEIRAQTAQADVLGSLDIAANFASPGGNVIVIDSGLQTTEPLDFATGLLSADPQTIVEYLKHNNELPNLTDRQVYFFGLGWIAAPQPNLGINYRKKVTQIWKAIAYASGARCVGVDLTQNPNNAVPNLPAVAIVTPPPPPLPIANCSTTNLNDSNHVGFRFDSTIFRDPAGARATLRKLANVILSNGDSITLTGSTSSEGSDQYNLALSLRRAEAVKAVLVQLGVPTSRIKTFGDGSHLPGRLNDRGPNGQLLIGPAIQNRKVVAKLTGPKCRSR